MTTAKTQVDENLCIGCGMCVSLCKKVYELDTVSGKAYIKNKEVFSEVTKEELEETVEECPVGAISFISE